MSLASLAVVCSLGCAGAAAHLRSDGALGRVVVYRNGVAYFERTAHVEGDTLRLRVPGNTIDDVLRSLTVVDVRTGEPIPVSYGTPPNEEITLAQMEITLGGPAPHDVKLTYLTEAPSWKASYRVNLGEKGKVTLQAWAIVDNTSAEDWESVKLGVGSSSALSFRFDLHSVRAVERDTLQADGLFAMAPPMGGATYGDESGPHVLGEISDEGLRALAPKPSEPVVTTEPDPASAPGKTTEERGVLVGTVIDNQTKKPIQDVVVEVAGSTGEQVVVTDRSGSYRVPDLPPGSFSIRISDEGYRPSGRSFTIAARQTIRANFTLTPASASAQAQEIVVMGRAPTIDAGMDSLGGAVRHAPSALRHSGPTRSFESVAHTAPGSSGPTSTAQRSAPPRTSQSPAGNAQPPPTDPAAQLGALAARLQRRSAPIIVEGYAGDADADKFAASLDRANRMRDELIRRGIAGPRVVAVGNGQKAGRGAGVRVVEVNADAEERPAGAEPPPESLQPVGASHFEADLPMTVPQGGSAMVSVLKAQTGGEVVYYYDPDSPRGDVRYPFRAVRLQNPTDSVLESGPVAVFGEGRFVGEGMCEPIPARSTAFVPFALDRQIVIERTGEERDEITRIIAAQRGVLLTEVEHIRRTRLVLQSRRSEPTSVVVRHVVPGGYRLTKGPNSDERLAGAPLFRLDVPANGSAEVVIEAQKSVFRSIDVRGADGVELLNAYLSSGAPSSGPLRACVDDLVKRTRQIGDIEQKIESARQAIDEHRARMEELREQIVTLRAVKTAGPLMRGLEQKLGEVSDHIQTETAGLVGLQEKLMVARIQLQDAIAELSLDASDTAVARAP